MTEPWKLRMLAWLQSHNGIISVAKLGDLGCGRRTAYRLLTSDDFEIVLSGVLRTRHWPLTEQQLMIAACVRNPDAVVSGLTAARHWKFRGLPDNDDVHILVPHGCSPKLPTAPTYSDEQELHPSSSS